MARKKAKGSFINNLYDYLGLRPFVAHPKVKQCTSYFGVRPKRSVPKIKTTQPLSSKVRLVTVLMFIITFLVFIIASGYWLFTFAKKVAIPTILGSKVQQTESTQVSPSPEITWETYTVRQGDNIRGIALQVYGDANAWVKIVQANNLKNPTIHAGNVLRIPR